VTPRAPRTAAAPRGSTLIEVLIGGTILLVAFLGFVGTVNTAATSNAVAHRRGTASWFRTGLLERYAVTPRARYASVPADTWVVDRCFDHASREVAANTSFVEDYECPASAAYRTWLQLTGAGPWTLSVYAERIDPGCAPEKRFSSGACVAADLYLTD
jgi:Tfp pilus assembly protein PilV